MAYGVSLAQLLVEMRAEARHSASAAAGINADASLRQMLARVQRTEWLSREWEHLKIRRDIVLVPGQRTYDWPADLSFDRATHAWVKWGNEWRFVAPGITESEYNHLDVGGEQDPVQRWGRTEDNHVEVWPTPATEATFRLCGIKALGPLVADGDVAALDSDLLVLLGAAELLVQQKAPDARVKAEAAQRVRNMLVGNADKPKVRSFLAGQRRGFGDSTGSRLEVTKGRGSMTWDSGVWGP